MAKQIGQIEITGTLGNMNFYQYKGRIIGRRRTSLNKDKILTLPTMEATRRNMNEMGRASNASKLLRHSIFNLTESCRDFEMHNRLNAIMRKILNSDTVNDLGLRAVEKGNLRLLKGFNFNINCGLENGSYGAYSVSVARSTGLSNIKIGRFSIKDFLRMPKAATHFQFVGAMVEINFLGRETWRSFSESGFISTNELVCNNILMGFKSEVESKWPMFFVMGVHFYDVVNGVMERLAESVYNGLDVIWVDEG
ncbi:MAG: hypothetical protein NVSMB45_13370 [Ginsengibacter sp.]